MPSVSVSPFGPKPAFFLSSGLPAVGYKLFFYLAGSVGTKQATYTDSTGTVANTNPVILDVNGTPPDELWFVTGAAYKVIYAPAADTDPPTSPIWTIDNLRGIGDATITPSEWVASSLVPTFLSTTSFSLVGDQTATFHVGRRLKSTNSSGFIYSTIIASVFSTVTTITVVNDAGVLDSGLVAVSYGIISAVHSSDPYQVSGSGDVVGPGSATAGHIVQFDGTTGKLIKDGLLLDTDGTLTGNSDTAVASQKATKTYVDAHAGSGDVVGPAGVIDSYFAQFDGVTGKLIKGLLAFDVDGTLAANSDAKVASQKAVKTYVDASGGTPGHFIEDEGTPLTQRGTLNFVGSGVAVTDAGGKTVVTVAGGASGDVVGPASSTDGHLVQFNGATGKLLKDGIALDTDGTLAANSDAAVASQKAVKTYVTAHSGTGDVVGPASSTADHFATYDGATGKLLKDTLALDTDTTLAANSDTRVASQKAVKAYVTASAGGSVSSITGTTGATGGDATVTGGTSTTSANAGGNAVIVGGTPGATGVGGAVSITGGTPVAGNGGAVSIGGSAGVGNAKTGGAVSVTGGTGGSTGASPGGAVTVKGGTGGTSSGSTGGLVTIQGGTAGSNSVSGGVDIQAGALGGGSSSSGNITIGGSVSTNGSGGTVTIKAGPYTSGTSATILVAAGDGRQGGAATFRGGDGTWFGGDATFRGGNAGDGPGGILNLLAGTSATTYAGSAVNITAGSAAGGSTNQAGGNVLIQTGAPTGTGARGNIQLDAGRGAAVGTTSTGGFVTIPTCAGTPTGVPANVPTGSVAMIFDTSANKLWIYDTSWLGVVLA